MKVKESILNQYSACKLCPRNCGADRYKKSGFCKSGTLAAVARADIHMWEEPCISGNMGSGTVFFSGCSLRCVFCQNHEISHSPKGEIISNEKLGDIFLRLQDKGAHNINLVNPTHYVPNIINALDIVKNKLTIPVVYNSSGYEKAETIAALEGYVDVFLPDLKYFSSDLSKKYSYAPDYFECASKAISKMIDVAGYPVFDENGMIKSGVIVRHLVLPSNVTDSKNILRFLAENFDTSRLYVSLMCQYFPTHKAYEYKEISRRLTSLEYGKVLSYAKELGIVNGFCQARSSAKEEYVPEFFDKLDF